MNEMNYSFNVHLMLGAYDRLIADPEWKLIHNLI